MAYKLLMALIRAGRTTNLQKMADVYLAAGRLTEDEYKAVTELIGVVR